MIYRINLLLKKMLSLTDEQNYLSHYYLSHYILGYFLPDINDVNEKFG